MIYFYILFKHSAENQEYPTSANTLNSRDASMWCMEADLFKRSSFRCQVVGTSYMVILVLFYAISQSATFIRRVFPHCISLTMQFSICFPWGRSFNPNSHAPFFVSRLSPRKGRGPKIGVPRLGFEPGASRTKCTVHPWHATRVSLPGQRFRSHMRPASMT